MAFKRRTFLATLLGAMGVRMPLEAIPLIPSVEGIPPPPLGTLVASQAGLQWEKVVFIPETRFLGIPHGSKSGQAYAYQGTWGWFHEGEPVWFPTLAPVSEEQKYKRQSALHLEMLEDVGPEDIMVRAREIGASHDHKSYRRKSDGSVEAELLPDTNKYLEE